MHQIDLQQLFQTAIAHHKGGQFLQAEALYGEILTKEPEHFGALYHLSMIAQLTGRHEAAVDLIRKALAVQPKNVDVYIALGNAQAQNGDFAEAIATYRHLLTLQPNNAHAFCNLADVLKIMGRLDESISASLQAIALAPKLPEAYNNLGNALIAKRQFEEAIGVCRQAIALRPRYSKAYNNLGNALQAMGQLDEAIADYRRAIEIDPSLPEVYSNLGNALGAIGKLEEAIASHRKAISLKPGLAEPHCNLGKVLKGNGQLDAAVAAYRQAIALQPGYYEAYSNLGNVLKDLGQTDEAITACRMAIQIKPDYVGAHSNLIFMIHYHPGYDGRAIAEETSLWNKRHAEPLRELVRPHINDRNPGRKLRIGYVSPDFRDHPVGRCVLPLLKHHDRSQFEVFAYAQVAVPDAMTKQLRSQTDEWRSTVGLSDVQVADLIRNDQIDILIDLAVHTANNRLTVFARKPAPVQVSTMGCPSTTGLATIDYRLTDPFLDPPGETQQDCSEQLIRLPHTALCYEPQAQVSHVNELPATQNGFITFGSLNNFAKINSNVLALWAEIMHRIPNSRLILKAAAGSHLDEARRIFEAASVSPDRIEFPGRQTAEAYFKLYHCIDLSLDPFPYNGHTTTFDNLWMGVPVITLAGRTCVGRAGVSVLSNLGLTNLIGKTTDEYAQLAIELANDLPTLLELRATLRQKMRASPLMDAQGYARDIESAFRQMWRKWCGKTEPNS